MSQMVLCVHPIITGYQKNKCIPEKRGQSSICCAESGNGQIKPHCFFDGSSFPYKKSLLLDEFNLQIVCGLVVTDVTNVSI